MDYYLSEYETQCDRDFELYCEQQDALTLATAPIGGPEIVEDDTVDDLPF